MSSSPRRILVLVTSMNRGGREMRLVDLLCHLDPARWTASLAVMHGGSLLRELPPEVPVWSRLAQYRGDPRLTWRLWRILRRQRPDLLWCAGTGVMAMLGLTYGPWLRVPVLLSIHGLVREDSRVFNPLERRLARSAARVLIPSDSYRERLTREGVPADRLAVQPNGLALERFQLADPDRRERRRALGIDWEGPLVGHVASLSDPKRQDVLLRAFALVRASLPEARLVVVGEGPRRSTLERLRAQLGLEDTVWLTGERTDVEELMPLFDVFALSSQMEGCPNAVIEAMASGVPVVATAAGGTPDVVDHGRTGLLVPVGNAPTLAEALLRLLRDVQEARRMGAEGRRRAEALFSLNKMVQDRMALFDQVLRPM